MTRWPSYYVPDPQTRPSDRDGGLGRLAARTLALRLARGPRMMAAGAR